MPAFLFFLLPGLKKYGLYILLGLVAIFTVLRVVAGLRNEGRLQERVEGMKRTIDAVKEREKVREEIAEEKRDSGRSSADILRDEFSRD